MVDSLTSALAAFRRMSRPLATWRVGKFLLSNRDPFPLRGWLDRTRPGVIGQDFVKGVAANIMVACWQGEVLASVGAVALETAKDFGAATIVRSAQLPVQRTESCASDPTICWSTGLGLVRIGRYGAGNLQKLPTN